MIKTAYYFVHDLQDAEDIAQDVCLEVLESAGSFRGNASFSTWIYRIAVNKSLNFIRKHKRRQLISRVEGLFLRKGEGGAQIAQEPHYSNLTLEDAERKRLLDESIGLLPEKQRTAFVLSKYEEMAHKDIAEVMDTSLAAVEQLLQRAKANLQKRLVVHFSEYSTTTIQKDGL